MPAVLFLLKAVPWLLGSSGTASPNQRMQLQGFLTRTCPESLYWEL
jgi:hypothetical protein